MAPNVFAASPNENECSIATAWSNAGWRLGWQETGKCTSPHCPAALAWRVCATADDTNRPAMRAAYRILRLGFMAGLIVVSEYILTTQMSNGLASPTGNKLVNANLRR